jgi:hypothetical protein
MDAKLRIAQWKERNPRLSPDEISMAFQGRKALSLWDMKVILADALHNDLLRLEGQTYDKIEESPEGLETPEGRVFNSEQKRRMVCVLKSLENHCKEQQLDQTMTRCADLISELERVMPASYTDLHLKATETAPAEPRTPAMAFGLTDHVWTIRELLSATIS